MREAKIQDGSALDARVPLAILAGSDRKPGPVPEGGEGFHFVVGYKGADLRAGERALVQTLVDRAREADVFSEVYVVGPRRVYASIVECPIVDTDSHVGQNMRAAIQELRGRHGHDTPIAFMACDILPTAAEISDLATRLLGAADDEGASALAISAVRWEEGFGASCWKPRYRILPAIGEPPLQVLPSHLAVAWPERLRTGLLHRLLDLVYRERNIDYEERRWVIVTRMLWSLLWRDLLNLGRLQPPTLTCTMLRHGLRAFLRWRRGDLTLAAFEHALGAMLVRRRHFRRHGARSVRIVVTGHESFARDFDTEEEIAEIRERLQSDAAQ